MGITVDDNKVVTFTSETEQLVNTSLDANPNHHKLNDLIVHSVFKRLYSRQGGDGNPLIYALKGQKGFSISLKECGKFNPNISKILHNLMHEKDYEVIPFQEIKQGKLVENKIDDYLNQWVEKDFEKLDNIVGVEINFNKIFYKYEKLRNVNEIFNDIKENEKLLSELDNDIFDLSPVELTEEELKSIED